MKNINKILLIPLMLYGLSSYGQNYPDQSGQQGDQSDGYTVTPGTFQFVGSAQDLDGDIAHILRCGTTAIDINVFLPQDAKVRAHVMEWNYSQLPGFTDIYTTGWIETIDASTPGNIGIYLNNVPVQSNTGYHIALEVKLFKGYNRKGKPKYGPKKNKRTRRFHIAEYCENGCMPIWNLPSLNASAGVANYHQKYEASNYITSSATLQVNEKAVFDAFNYVELTPGFHADLGSNFHAYIDGCGGKSNIFEGGKLAKSNDDDLSGKSDPILDVLSKNLKMSPNPTTGLFTVNIAGNMDGRLQIFNMLGNMVWENNYSTDRVVIDLSNERPGVYIVKWTSDQSTVTGRIIKQ